MQDLFRICLRFSKICNKILLEAIKIWLFRIYEIVWNEPYDTIDY